MSRQQSFRVAELVRQVLATPTEDVYQDHGIIIHEDGTVVDPVYDQTFDTLTDWAIYNVEMEIEEENTTHYGSLED